MRTLPETHPIPAAPPPSQNPHRLRRSMMLAMAIVVLLAGGAGAFFYKRAQAAFKNTQDASINAFPVTDPGGAMNILLIGSDTREGLDKREQSLPAFYRSGGKRSDTIILVHLFGDGKHAAVLSFPRDLRVPVPGYGRTKINAAYNLGPNNVITTVQDYTGLRVNYYVEVNFVAFRKIVDALGGVEMCVKHAYNDPDANLFIKKAGCYNFDGDTALGFARTRKQDPRGDFDRIDHQQQLIRVMLQKATSLGIVFTPWKIIGIINAIEKTLKTSKGFDMHLAFGLAGRLKDAGDGANQRVDFRIVPSRPAYIGGVSYVVAEPEAQQIFDAIKSDTWPLPDIASSKTAASIPKPADVVVRIYDGSGTGAGKALRERLKALGFQLKILRTVARVEKTEIWFRPGDELKAQLVDEELGFGAVKAGARADPDTDVTIILGADAASQPSASPNG